MMGEKSFISQIEEDAARTEGDLGVLEQLASAAIDFDRFFEILPGTKVHPMAADLTDFEFDQVGGGHE
jgi:hypothetical protein